MKKFIIQAGIGIFAFIASAICFYLFIISLDGSVNVICLALAIILLPVSVYFLIQAGKSDALMTAKPKTTLSINGNDQPNTLKKQNDMVNTWKKTMEDRDKLKMLEIASKSEQS